LRMGASFFLDVIAFISALAGLLAVVVAILSWVARTYRVARDYLEGVVLQREDQVGGLERKFDSAHRILVYVRGGMDEKIGAYE